MKCVDWKYRKDKEQTMKLLSEWASVEVDDALDLLSSAFRGTIESLLVPYSGSLSPYNLSLYRH